MNSDPQSIHQLPKGTILKNRYQIDAVLGEGGFGITYRGTDQMLEITVAVKEFYPHGYAVRNCASSLQVTLISGQGFFDKWRDRFLTEARILAKCTNVPSIVQVRDFFEENNTAYIVMEYLSGIPLQDYILQNGIIPAERMFSYIIPLVRDLDRVHRLGLVHRDISPDNIMLMPDDSLKLFDFGAARNYSDEEHRTLSIMLKPGYAPEEQYRTKGIQGPWTDIYAICATMYKCITGVTPPDSLERLNEDELRAPSELGCPISAGMEQVLLKGMSIRAADRFQDAASLADAMEASMKNPAAQSSVTQSVTVFMEDSEENAKENSKAETQPKIIKTPAVISGGPISIDEESANPLASANASPVKKNRKFLWILAAVLVIVVLTINLILTANKKSQPDTALQTQQNSVSQTQQDTDSQTQTETEPMIQQDVNPDINAPADDTAIHQAEETASDDTDATSQMTDGDYEPVSGKTLLDSVLWGVHDYADDSFPSGSNYFMDIATDCGTLNVSEFPIAFLINPSWKEEPLICLCFTDQFQYLYFVYGTYQTDKGVLKISAPVHPESLPRLNPSDILKNSFYLNKHPYICEAGTSYPAEETAYVLKDSIQLSWSLSSGGTGVLFFKNDKHSIRYHSGYLQTGNSKNQILHLQGKASDPGRMYKGMEGLDLVYDPVLKESAVTIYFADGGQSLDASVSSYLDSLYSITLTASQISRPYNGRTETFSESHSLHFFYLNTYPFGFILYDVETKEYYYYQRSLESAE